MCHSSVYNVLCIGCVFRICMYVACQFVHDLSKNLISFKMCTKCTIERMLKYFGITFHSGQQRDSRRVLGEGKIGKWSKYDPITFNNNNQ